MISAYMSLHSNVNDRECQIQSYRGMTIMVGGQIQFPQWFLGLKSQRKTELLFLVHNYAMIEPIYQSAMLFTESIIYEK